MYFVVPSRLYKREFSSIDDGVIDGVGVIDSVGVIDGVGVIDDVRVIDGAGVLIVTGKLSFI